MATLQGSDESNTSIQPVEQDNRNFNEEEMKKIQANIKKSHQREEPINILVTGPTGAGKSTLINAMMGDAVAKVSHGAGSVQSEVTVHEGEYEGIQLKVYDTTGFSDTGGATVISKIARNNKFHLILICVRMDSRTDKGVGKLFTDLENMINKEMWDRSVIVLTFANAFLQQRSIRESPNKAEIIRSEIEDFKGHVHKFLSTLRKETIDEIPFCIAGEEDERNLPTTDDWLKDLWDQCLKRCSKDARELLAATAKYQMLQVGVVSGTTAVLAVVGGAIGAAGSVKIIAGAAVVGMIGLGIAYFLK